MSCGAELASVWRSGSSGAVPDGMAGVEGLAEGLVDGRRYTACLEGPIQPLLRFLATQPVTGMLVEEPDLEEAFLDLYEEES